MSPAAGTPLVLERIGGYPHAVIRILFRKYGLARALPTERGIALRRLTYRTSAPDGRGVAASGLVAMPRGRAPYRGIVSWQHGTASLRSAAPSSKDVANGLFPAAAFAGHGYITLAPDYLGYGVSEEPHEYYLADNMAAVVRDFVQAARMALANQGVGLPSKLFLAGFSEGGHATLAAQRAIERSPITGLSLVASAPVAAAVDLAGLGLTGALAGGSKFCSLYLAWLAKSYAHHYREPLRTVLEPQWASAAERCFDGMHDGESTVAALPDDPRDLMDNGFLAAHDAAGEHWFLTRLRENGLLDWRPRAPIRAYFGRNDADVAPEQAELLRDNYRANGGDATAICVGDVDHDTSVLRAAPYIRDWFDEVAAGSGR